MGSYATIMSVRNRIKILNCRNFEEVENKVNDFLAFDENIAALAGIDYRLEYNVVIIEYYVIDHQNDHDDKMDLGHSSYGYSSPFTNWMKLCFPF